MLIRVNPGEQQSGSVVLMVGVQYMLGAPSFIN